MLSERIEFDAKITSQVIVIKLHQKQTEIRLQHECLFCGKIRSWSLLFRHFGVCLVNKYSIEH